MGGKLRVVWGGMVAESVQSHLLSNDIKPRSNEYKVNYM